MKLIKPILEEAAAIASLRRDLHAHPELGYQEERTAALIADTLSGWGIAVHRGLGGTGVVGTIRNGSAMRAIGLRADIDALPVTDATPSPMRASMPAGCMPVVTMVTPRCCSLRPATWPGNGTSMARCTSCSSRPRKAAAARAP